MRLPTAPLRTANGLPPGHCTKRQPADRAPRITGKPDTRAGLSGADLPVCLPGGSLDQAEEGRPGGAPHIERVALAVHAYHSRADRSLWSAPGRLAESRGCGEMGAWTSTRPISPAGWCWWARRPWFRSTSALRPCGATMRRSALCTIRPTVRPPTGYQRSNRSNPGSEPGP
jgi:hypothetical protein